MRRVVNHVNDCERLFLLRAFWFARGFDSPLPSFDQHTAADAARADAFPWASHVEGFRKIRLATLSFFRNLPAEAWMRRGIASDLPFTVRALAWIAAGHLDHHLAILRERYISRLPPPPSPSGSLFRITAIAAPGELLRIGGSASGAGPEVLGRTRGRDPGSRRLFFAGRAPDLAARDRDAAG